MIGETLSHYRVLERLGSGGMGDVYRAEDLRLRRDVALKTLRNDAVEPDTTQRLLAEARAASALNHPNIAVVYEADEVEHQGRRIGYIAMEYVEGTTVAELASLGPLDLDRILDIVEPIADALAEAHAHGLVHRDLKPSNVMVTPAGRVKVLDFGVALRRDTRVAAPDEATRTVDLTAGLAVFVGTLPYAAPEQATGREVDGRADMFSLGVMLYELACGKRPFGGNNAAQVLEAILRDDVPPFPDLHRDARLPQVERLVRRMLARDPERRFAGLSEVRDALATIRGGGRLPDAIEQTRDANSIAVAAFVNISGNPEDDWLGAGISETLTADAGQLEGLSVIARERVSEILKTLSQQTGERGEGLLLQAGRELRARWVVSGGFQRSGDAVRVTASVTEVASGQLVGTARVDGRLQAVFELQDRLVRELAGTLRAAIAPAAAAGPETEVVEAYEAFSRGLLNRRAETFEVAGSGGVAVRARGERGSGVRARAPGARRRLRDESRLPVDARAAAARGRQPSARDRAAAGIGARLARARPGAGRHVPGRRGDGRHPARPGDRSGGRQHPCRDGPRALHRQRPLCRGRRLVRARARATTPRAGGTRCSSRTVRR